MMDFACKPIDIIEKAERMSPRVVKYPVFRRWSVVKGRVSSTPDVTLSMAVWILGLVGVVGGCVLFCDFFFSSPWWVGVSAGVLLGAVWSVFSFSWAWEESAAQKGMLIADRYGLFRFCVSSPIPSEAVLELSAVGVALGKLEALEDKLDPPPPGWSEGFDVFYCRDSITSTRSRLENDWEDVLRKYDLHR